jgi:hypothetical protein
MRHTEYVPVDDEAMEKFKQMMYFQDPPQPIKKVMAEALRLGLIVEKDKEPQS